MSKFVNRPAFSATILSSRSRSSDIGGAGGGGHPDPGIREVGSPNFFFQPFGPHFGRKIKAGGGGGGGGASPGSATATLAILIPPVCLFEQAIF